MLQLYCTQFNRILSLCTFSPFFLFDLKEDAKKSRKERETEKKYDYAKEFLEKHDDDNEETGDAGKRLVVVLSRQDSFSVYGIKKVQDECMWCLKRTYRHGDSVRGVVVMHVIHREKEFQVPKVILFFSLSSFSDVLYILSLLLLYMHVNTPLYS